MEKSLSDMSTEELMAVIKEREADAKEVTNGKIVNITEASSMKITNFNDLCEYSKGSVVELPPFAEGQPFVARLQRPSLIGLVRSGKIPNTLLKTATDLFDGGGADTESVLDDVEALGEMVDIMEIICEASLVSPTYDEIKKAGVKLSDNQMMAIFNYAQTGVIALDSFR